MAAQTSISTSKKENLIVQVMDSYFQWRTENVDLPQTAAFKTCTEFYNLVQLYKK